MWKVHLDPRLPDLHDSPMDDHRVAKKVAEGEIRSDTWISHPAHTEGKVIPAARVRWLRDLLIQFGQ